MLQRLFAVPVVCLSMLFVTACASKPEQAKLQQYIQTIEVAYSTAKAIVPVFCIAVPNVPPCNSPGAMAEIVKAEAVLDLAWTKAKENISAAQDASAITIATKAFMDAIAVYSKIAATYGINRGGG